MSYNGKVKKDLTDEEKAARYAERTRAEAMREFKSSPGPVTCKICGASIYKHDVISGRAGYARGRLGRAFVCPECYRGGDTNG